MNIENFPRFTVILRGVSLEETDKIIKNLSKYNNKYAVEITLNTNNALSIISQVRKKYKDQILIGAGTVRNIKDVTDAINAGAQFCLSPHIMTSEMVETCHFNSVLAIPAAFTPSEIVSQLDLNADIVKVFPAERLSVDFFKDVSGPLGKLPLMAVGGINKNNYKQYFNAGVDYVGIGSSMFKEISILEATDEQIQEILNHYN